MDDLTVRGWHDALLWTAGRLPFRELQAARAMLVERRQHDLAQLVLGELSVAGRPVDPGLLERLESVLGELDGNSLPPSPEPEPGTATSSWTFASALVPGREPWTAPIDATSDGGYPFTYDPVVRRIVEILGAFPVDAVWQTWQLPTSGAPDVDPVRVLIVLPAPQLPDPMMPELATYLPTAVGQVDGPPITVEIYRSGSALSRYQRVARAHGALLSVGAEVTEPPEVRRHRTLVAAFAPVVEVGPDGVAAVAAVGTAGPAAQPVSRQVLAIDAAPPPGPPREATRHVPAAPQSAAHSLPDAAAAGSASDGQAPPVAPQDAPQDARPDARPDAPLETLVAEPGPPRPAARRAGAARPVVSWQPLTASATPADREVLRAVLGHRVDAHARVVNALVSVDPRLRLVGSGDDLLCGLVALRAYLFGQLDGLDRWLRGEPAAGDGLPGKTVQVLARCVLSGLNRLPVVRGPVFCTVAAGSGSVEAYAPDQVIAEPAFTLVSTGPGISGDAGVRYAIWSSSARRLDALIPSEEGPEWPRVAIPAGTRFAVLGTDGDPPAGAWSTVLLQELFPGRRRLHPAAVAAGSPSIRVLDKLREALDAPAAGAASIPARTRPLGIRADGALFDVEGRAADAVLATTA